MNTLIIIVAQYAIFLLPLFILCAYMIIERPEKKRFVITFIIGGIVGYILLWIAGKLYYDPRPFVASGIHPLFSHITDNGFPSDHTFAASLAAFLVFAFSRKLG